MIFLVKSEGMLSTFPLLIWAMQSNAFCFQNKLAAKTRNQLGVHAFSSFDGGIINGSASELIAPPESLIGLISAYSSVSTITAHEQVAPLAQSIFFLPPRYHSQEVKFVQKTTGTIIEGRDLLLSMVSRWENQFNENQDVATSLERVSLLPGNNATQMTLRVQWNITWVPASAWWLQLLPARQRHYASYSHLAGQISTFSWKAVGQLFAAYFRTGTLRIPLACIQGITDLSMLENKGAWQVEQIQEDFFYAIDLRRGSLLNRKCAGDLRLFLEVARSCYDTADSNNSLWYDLVATSLPWGSVPGSRTLDVDDTEEGPLAAVVFLSVTTIALIGLASILGPELIGQSLWKLPTEVLRLEDTDFIFD